MLKKLKLDSIPKIILFRINDNICDLAYGSGNYLCDKYDEKNKSKKVIADLATA